MDFPVSPDQHWSIGGSLCLYSVLPQGIKPGLESAASERKRSGVGSLAIAAAMCICECEWTPTGFMRVKMNIALRKRTLSPVRLVLEDSSNRSFMLFVVVSLQLGSILESNLILNTKHCTLRKSVIEISKLKT